jgi:hypothetical protein
MLWETGSIGNSADREDGRFIEHVEGAFVAGCDGREYNAGLSTETWFIDVLKRDFG